MKMEKKRKRERKRRQRRDRWIRKKQCNEGELGKNATQDTYVSSLIL